MRARVLVGFMLFVEVARVSRWEAFEVMQNPWGGRVGVLCK